MTSVLPINTLAGRGIGDNCPPLSELLKEETAPLAERAGELLAAAREARIENASDAGKVADLIALIRNLERAVDRARDERKRPHLANCRIIDAIFGQIVGPLARARTGADSLSEMLTAWQREHPDDLPQASYAGIGSRREISFVIEDLPAVVGWLLSERPGEITQAARTIIGAALRSIGVDMAGEAKIPGITVTVHTKTRVR